MRSAVRFALFGWLAAGCFLQGFDREDGGGAGATGATGGGGATAAGGGGAGGDSQCDSATYPDAPGATGGDELLDLAFALRRVDLGEEDIDNRPGFDLDRVCSCCTDCVAEQDHCQPPSYADATKLCDAAADGSSHNQGRDNALAQVIESFGELGDQIPAGTASMNDRIASGQWSMLIRVSGYNGLPDDDNVTVSLFTTDGLGSAPQWTGAEPWPVRTDSLLPTYDTFTNPLDAATVLNATAYVSAGRLVGVFDGSGGDQNRLSLSLEGGFSLSLTYAIFSADLVKEGSYWALEEGTLGGLWALAEVFETLSAIRPPLCTDDFVYGIFKDRLCEYVDGRAGPPGPGLCDSISFGLWFEADAITFGPLEDPSGDTPGCPPATDPASDSCP